MPFNEFSRQFKFPSFPTMKEALAPKPKFGGGEGNPIKQSFRREVTEFEFGNQQPAQSDWGAEMFDELESEFDRYMKGEWVSWPSTNCVGGRYIADQLYMELEFKDGSYYGYFNITPEEAASMYRATSHGGWVWDNLRIRGTKLGYRKEYVWLSAPSAIQRKWDRDPITAAEHGLEARRQTHEALRNEMFGSWSIKGQFSRNM